MQSDATPDPLAPRTQEDRSDDGDFLYPWDDWATERRAQMLLAKALAACVPDAQGEVVAGLDALGRLETAYNGAMAHLLIGASEGLFHANPEFHSVGVHFGGPYSDGHGAGIGYYRGGGWLSHDTAEEIKGRLLLPRSAARVYYAPRAEPGPTKPHHTAPLPPGPHRGCGWFDVIVSALVYPEDDSDHGARPLDGQLCTAAIALAQALVSMGDERTAPFYVTKCGIGSDGVQAIYQDPPTRRGQWSVMRSGLIAFISLMKRIHATWSLYLPLVAPTEHAINCALMPGIVE